MQSLNYRFQIRVIDLDWRQNWYHPGFYLTGRTFTADNKRGESRHKQDFHFIILIKLINALVIKLCNIIKIRETI